MKFVNISKLVVLIFAVTAMFTACSEDAIIENSINGEMSDTKKEQDRLLEIDAVGYLDIFDKPSGKILKTATTSIDIWYKNFSTGTITKYKAVWDGTNSQIWLAENLKEEQNFAVSSMTNPNDPNGSQYGYFYYYDDIEIEPQTSFVAVPPPGRTVRNWGFYWDDACQQLIDVEWRIPVHNDVQQLVNHVGATDRVVLANYGIDVSFCGWYANGTWQSYLQDGCFWIKDNASNPIKHPYDHWAFRTSTYITQYPHPEFFFSASYDYMAYNIRLVADY